MQTIRLSAFSGADDLDNAGESHLVIAESEDKSREILDSFGSLNDARLYAMAICKVSADFQEGFSEKKSRTKSAA
ncbi:MAG TPA: hypothetical protein VHT27_13150 [Solirubrobacteraceae bacterium]|jgi:hypothetical protein|nr:hypothetical protein [Solirubrobacteraceae bacterium]